MNSVDQGMRFSIQKQLPGINNCFSPLHHRGDVLPKEAVHESEPHHKPPVQWPTHGVVDLKNLTMAYSPGLPICTEYRCMQIKAREKIGVVSRTGAGKFLFPTTSIFLHRLIRQLPVNLLNMPVSWKTLSRNSSVNLNLPRYSILISFLYDDYSDLCPLF
jgi:hypothetical protein